MSRPIHSNFNQHFLLPPALTDWISPGDPVWFIKDFVEALDLDALGFSQHKPSLDGRAYYPRICCYAQAADSRGSFGFGTSKNSTSAPKRA